MTPPFPGDWRPVAPTIAQVAAHAGGWWWRWWPGKPPVADRLTVNSGGVWESVCSDDDANQWPTQTWAHVDGAQWRGDALVCPGDANGTPVAWP